MTTLGPPLALLVKNANPLHEYRRRLGVLSPMVDSTNHGTLSALFHTRYGIERGRLLSGRHVQSKCCRRYLLRIRSLFLGSTLRF